MRRVRYMCAWASVTPASGVERRLGFRFVVEFGESFDNDMMMKMNI